MNSSSSSIERKYIYGETTDSDEDNDIRHEGESDGEEEEKEEETHFSAPKLRPYGNTGPKGVIQDYREAEERMAQRQAAKLREVQLLAEKNSCALDKPEDEDDLEAAKLLAEAEGDEETALAYELYRKQRLLEAYQKMQAGNGGSGGSNVKALGTYDYMSTIHDADPDRYVVIHEYSDAVGSCRPIGRLLEHLARDKVLAGRCDFCKISGRDSLDSFSEAVMPVLLVYKRGELVQCHMRLRAPEALLDALKDDGVIKPTERISVPAELLEEDEFDGGCDEEDDDDEDDDDDDDDY